MRPALRPAAHGVHQHPPLSGRQGFYQGDESLVAGDLAGCEVNARLGQSAGQARGVQRLCEHGAAYLTLGTAHFPHARQHGTHLLAYQRPELVASIVGQLGKHAHESRGGIEHA